MFTYNISLTEVHLKEVNSKEWKEPNGSKPYVAWVGISLRKANLFVHVFEHLRSG